ETIIRSHYRSLSAEKSPTTRPHARSRPAPDMPEERVDRIRGLPAEDQVRVVRILQRAHKLFPLSETGHRAGIDVRSLMDDPDFARRLAENKHSVRARKMLQVAKAYENAGMKAKAIAKYREIIKLDGDSEPAKKAGQRITVLQAELKAAGMLKQNREK
ncbi:MAG: tetratricopeptide repeat protein, partial [Phycisphaerae bacterium]